MTAQRREATDDLHLLLKALPPEICRGIEALPPERDLIEVIMDLGRPPEARFGGGGEQVLLEREIAEEDIQYVIDHIGSFGDDNRAGIERTLHRISAIRNRNGKIVGLTCRIGRAVFGTIEIIGDLVESGKSVLIMGRPGIGKTTMLREAARVIADEVDKRVVVVDTSNEIAGDGDIPHPGIGRARRMQVRTPAQQHAVMIEAVENHMPEVIVIDEIGTELEASAARTIAERGVQLIGTAHGNNLDNLMLNPTLSDLIGGIQSVTLGDEEARRRRTQKSVLERKAPPTFDVVVEIQDRERVTVHADVAETVDALLRGEALAPELRWRDESGVHKSQSRPRPGPATQLPGERFGGLVGGGPAGWRVEPGWRPDAPRYGGSGYVEPERSARPGYRSGTSGGWRTPRTRGGHRGSAGSSGPSRGGPPEREGPRAGGPPPTIPGERLSGPFRTAELADRGPLEPTAPPVFESPAREARELERQRAWRESATRALSALRAEEGTGPVADDDDETDPAAALTSLAAGTPARAAMPQTMDDLDDDELDADGYADADDDDEDEDDSFDDADDADDGDDEEDDDGEAVAEATNGTSHGNGAIPASTILPTLHVYGFGVSRKRLEQAIRELQLPVIVVRDVDDADVVITLRNLYRQKAPALREAEDRAIPLYVLKSNTLMQIEACLTSLYALEIDPRDAALREVEEAIGLVINGAKPIELSPQNAYIRRLQHQMAERANLVSRSRGREPYRRVRLYPDQARAWR